MKFTLVVNQRAVVDAGLVGKVNLQDLCLLHYLSGWSTYEGAKTTVLDRRKFFWLHYERAIEELPLLFNPAATLASRKNQLSAMMRKLREAGLVETTMSGRRLYFRLTEPTLNICKRPARLATSTKQSIPIATPRHDETDMPQQDEIITPTHDECPSAIFNESCTMKQEEIETPPLSPSEGEGDAILAFWNSIPGLMSAKTLTSNRARKIRKHLADPWWRTHWREGIQRIAKSDFAVGGGDQGWRANFDWFLGADTLTKILEGQYDNRPKTSPKSTISDLKAKRAALVTLIETHPANHGSQSYNEDCTSHDRKNLAKLREEVEALTRRIAAAPV